MSSARKLTIVGGLFLFGAIAVALYVVVWLAYNPETIVAKGQVNSAGQLSTHLELATTGSIDFGTHPTWVAYLIRQDGKWVSSTVWQVPAHSLVHVTILEYDSQTGLRNPFMSMVRGTVGGVAYENGKAIRYMDPSLPAHTFSIPEFGLNVPLEGISQSNYPADLTNPNNTHVTINFSFRTGGPETVHWQCFVPCAAGFLFGQGGPMQTVGYMDGYLKVVAS
ncbi:MAG TPA: hypothetical protein VNH20_07080 [Candidatus Dormibacteraeota bacterium]|nr:hypothetical protein [Candidatus Dormibacteraeota bacterium]